MLGSGTLHFNDGYGGSVANLDIESGIVQLGNASAFGNQGTIIVGFGGTLDLNGSPLPSTVCVDAYYGAIINEG